MIVEQLPRIVACVFSAYALFLIFGRWQATHVMTQDKRYLLLFFVLQNFTQLLSAYLKIKHGIAPDISTWLTVLTQSFLAAYLYYSIPAQFKRWYYRFTRRSKT